MTEHQERELQELLDYEPDENQERLSDWELNFLESINLKRDQGWKLTTKQSEKLTQIWDKIFGD